MFYCRTITKVVSSLGILTLCLDSEEFTSESEGFIIGNPSFYFQATRKNKPCRFKVSLLLYAFDLCLYPIKHPITITYKKDNKYENLTLFP